MDIDKIIELVYEEVKKRCMLPTNEYGIGAWNHHIKLVYEIAIETYKEYNASYDIVALSSLLHDVAAVTNIKYAENHHIIGAKIADQILTNYSLERNKIEQIKKCILNHRGSVLIEKCTPEEICIADSDAMAHFKSIPSLLRMVYVEKGLSIDDGAKFVSDKLERSYNKLSQTGKKIIDPYYNASKILLIKK